MINNKHYYRKEVDLNSTDSIIEYLDSHYAYEGEYAHNVKLYNLGMDDVDFEIISDITVGLSYYGIYTAHTEQFLKKYPALKIEFRGNNAGYLVLLSDSYNWAAPKYDLNGFDPEDLLYTASAVKDFDLMVDYLRIELIKLYDAVKGKARV